MLRALSGERGELARPIFSLEHAEAVREVWLILIL